MGARLAGDCETVRRPQGELPQVQWPHDRRHQEQLDHYIWGDGLTRYGAPGRFGAGVLRNLWAVMRDIASGELNLRAMSLVYTTLLSIVPLIAVSFSALKAFGVHKDIEPHLYGFLEPLGPKGAEITDYVMSLVNNVNSNVLGGIGFIFFHLHRDLDGAENRRLV